jgi:hypothetical protein
MPPLLPLKYTIATRDINHLHPHTFISKHRLLSSTQSAVPCKSKLLHPLFEKMTKRRPPPTSLILPPPSQPLPTRRQPKYTLPSPPLPTFYRHSSLSGGHHHDDKLSELLAQVQNASDEEKIRGPWDHSGCIRLPFDVETVLSPLKPAASR